MRNQLLAVFFAILAGSIAGAARPAVAQSGLGQASISIVGPSEIVARPGQVPAERLRFRVVDAQGQPMAGLNASFLVNTGAYFPEQPPLFGAYGFFLVPPPVNTSESFDTATNADGIATAPAFRLSASSFEVIGRVGGNAALDAQRLLVTYTITPDENAGNIVTGGGDAVGLPVDSSTMLTGMVLALLGLACWRLRRRSSAY
jgi:hypothetical protein